MDTLLLIYVVSSIISLGILIILLIAILQGDL